jgi:transcriptional regulator with XRE-family HTH domain
MNASGSRDLGERFRAAREARGLTLSEVAEQIRIRSVYLAAIEDEHWNAIGAPVYARGFMRTYARFLGMDPEEAVAEFNRRQDVSTAATAQDVAQAPRQRTRPSGALIWVAGLVAVVLIAFVVYNEVAMRAQQSPGPVADATATTDGAASATPDLPTPTPVPALGGANSLALVLSAPSWLRVTVDGSVSMEGTFPAGTSKTFHGKNAQVRIGNAGGVEVFVDGKDRGKLGASGDVVEYNFTL